MAANVEGLRARLVEHYQAVATAAVEATVAALKEASPRREGVLADSISADVPTFTGSGFVAAIRATAPQAEWTNWGTVAHWIPTEGRASKRTLRFEVGGEVRFARYVWHPGNTGTRWWDNTLEVEWSGQLRAAA